MIAIARPLAIGLHLNPRLTKSARHEQVRGSCLSSAEMPTLPSVTCVPTPATRPLPTSSPIAGQRTIGWPNWVA